jgi:putative peptidoglycan lipid II flippase
LIEPTTNLPPEDAAVAQPPAAVSEDGGLVRATAILAVGNVASRILGLVREIVKSNLFGASDLLGAYTVASLIPTTLFNLIIGGEMVSSSLVPVFSDYADPEKRPELWGLVSTFLSLAAAVLAVLVILVELFTSQVAWLIGAHEFEDPTLLPITIDLMRLATPAVLFMSVASILTGLLFALKRFTLPAFTGAIFNGTIVVVALLRPEEIDSLVWGLLAGSFLQIILQLPALRDGRFRLQFNWQHPAIRRIIFLYTPIVAGLVINQAANWISYRLAITTGDNSVTYMAYATTLYQFPLGLVVTALSMATLPTLSRLSTAYQTALSNADGSAGLRLGVYKETLASGIRLAATLILPATAGLFALAAPIIALLFEHGQFLPQDTDITTQVLRLYLFGLPFAALDQMLVFASYARKDTWRPALVGVISIVIYTITAVVLLRPLGLLSLMVADSIKHIVHTVMMLWLLQRQLGGLRGYRISHSLFRALAAALLTGLGAYSVWLLTASILPGAGFLARLFHVALPGTAGLVVFMTAVVILDIREVRGLWQIALRRKS